MTDFLLELSKNPNARKVVKQLGLPLPMPQALRRAKGAWEARPLANKKVVVGTTEGAELGVLLAETLAPAGAEPVLVGPHDVAAYEGPGEAYGRPPTVMTGATPDRFLAHGLVFDATGLSTPDALGALHDFFHPLVGRLARCGRVVVVGRPASGGDVAFGATQRALEGFVRSLAKELGRRGATAHLVTVEPGAEGRAAAVLRFLLSERSAFLSGQPFHVTRQASDAAPARWTRPLDGKVVLVTGAARGIGKATAGLLADEGAHVVCLDRPADDGPLSRVAADVGGSMLLQDISADDAPEAITAALRERHGTVHAVVHNAGVTRDKTLAKMKRDRWDQTLDINLGAVVRIDAALLDAGVLSDGGRIICLSSVAGIAGNMGQTNYAASKAGIIGYVDAQGRALAARGICVNAIAPGFIETRMTAAIPPVIRQAGRRLSNLGQGGQPRDIGDLVVFLASPGSQGLTRGVLRACGGALIGA